MKNLLFKIYDNYNTSRTNLSESFIDNNKQNKLKKIAIIIEKFVDIPSGGEPVIHFNFINYLINEGYEVNIYCEKLELKNKINTITIYDNFIKNKDLYLNYIQNNNYDYIISSRFGLKFTDLSADLYTIHSHSDLYSQKSKFGIFYNILKPKRKRILTEINSLKKNTNAKFIFCSKQLKEDYCSLAQIKSNEILTPYPNCEPKDNYEHIQNKTFTFGISSIGFQNKGGYLTLKSAFLLKLSNKNFKIKMIYKHNGGFFQNLLINFFGLKKHIEFLPKQENMNEFYKSIDCLLMPSSLESFGMVAIEAMKFNLPVIISSTSGCKEIVEHNKNGFIFDISSKPTLNLYKEMKKVMSLNNDSNLQKNILTTQINTKENYNNTLLKILLKEEKNA